MLFRWYKFLLPVPLLFPLQVQAVTCSCASVPLLGSMESVSPESDTLYAGVIYEYRDLGATISGNDSIDDGTDRKRITRSTIVEISRGLSENWSVSALFSHVSHLREVGDSDHQMTEGLGDTVLMLKYSFSRIRIYSRHALTLGIGARLPTGENEIRNNGILLAEDLQPGNGAHAFIGWINYSRSFSQLANLQLHTTLSYTLNQENDRHYQFGDENSMELGISYQSNAPWGYILGLGYRHAERDQRNGAEIPNTGGEWLDFKPALQYHFTSSLAVKLGATIPLHRKLNDAIQFTTKNAVSFSLAYIFE